MSDMNGVVVRADEMIGTATLVAPACARCLEI